MGTTKSIKELFYKYIGIGFVCGLFFLLGLPSLNQMIIYTPDSARYLAWANSLAGFEGFKDTTTPEPSRYVVHAPLYSILLAPSAWFFHQSVIAAKVTTLLIGIILIFIFHAWIKRRTGEQAALLGSALLALNPLMMIYSTQILSDIPFALCVILFFLYAEKLVVENNPSQVAEYILVAIITAGVFFRDIGLTLMFGAVVFFLIRKEYRRAALVCLIPLVLYLLWFVRNEIFIAGDENPTLRNSQVFFMHLYTSSQESLFTEFGRRLWNNLTLYSDFIGKIIVIPDFSQRSLSLISSSNPFVSMIFRTLPVTKIILIITSLGLCGIGFWQERQHGKSFLLISTFLVCYLIPIVFYPISDQRFLFPLLLVMIYLCAAGAKYCYEWWQLHVKVQGASVVVLFAGLLFLIPNIAWLQNYIYNSYQYGRSPEQLYDQLKTEPEYPGQFSKPLHLAGKWIVEHNQNSVVVLSRWKELSFWLEGNKVVEAFPQITPNAFESLLRDYSVKYIVAVVTRVGLNEFEGLIDRSQRFACTLVYRVGDVEVFEVSRRKDQKEKNAFDQSSDSTVRTLYRQALMVMEKHPAEAERSLMRIPVCIGGYSEIIFQIGVAKEFAGEIDSAIVQFGKFRSMTQAGAYIQLASNHLEMISRVQMAGSLDNTLQRAEAYQLLAVHYWELGYRKRAIDMLTRSLEAEREFFPTLIVSALFSLQQGDTVFAWTNLNKARALQPDHPLTIGLATIEQCCQNLKSTKDPMKQIELHLKIVSSYIEMGLRENAMNELVEILSIHPSSEKALLILGRLMEEKKRYQPALRCYEKILEMDPLNREVIDKANSLLARF